MNQTVKAEIAKRLKLRDEREAKLLAMKARKQRGIQIFIPEEYVEALEFEVAEQMEAKFLPAHHIKKEIFVELLRPLYEKHASKFDFS